MTDTIYNAIISVLFDMNNCTLRQSSLIPGWLSQGGGKAHPESSEISETLRKTIRGGDHVIRYSIGDDGQYDGTYDLEDSLNVCQFPHKPTVVDYSPKIKAKAEKDDEERESLLRSLGSRPTVTFPAVSASDFAGLLEDLYNADTMPRKADMLEMWSAFFHDDMRETLKKLAEAIRKNDRETARRLIATIRVAS